MIKALDLRKSPVVELRKANEKFNYTMPIT